MKLNVGVIFGGESVEHEVSIISALQAMKALDPERYNVIPIYVTKKRRLYSSEKLKEVAVYRDMDALVRETDEVYIINQGSKVLMKPVKAKWLDRHYPIALDVVIPVIHGTNGEDGVIQGYLEMLKVPYGGCDVIAAGVGQDKVIMKYVLAGSDLPICDWLWFYAHEFEARKNELVPAIAKLGYPVIIKPACLGSSVGIQIVHNREELPEAIREAGRYDRKLVVEQMVKHLVEINCSVLGDCYKCEASNLEQVMKNEEILSYKDKYEGSAKTKGGSKGMASTSRIIPAPLSPTKTAQIKTLAIAAFKALGASGVCRIDFLMDGDTEQVYINEINTIPGSLAFYLWQDSGVDFSELMDRLVKQAIDRQRRREQMVYSYDTNILAGYSEGTKGKLKG